jgi:hypothetical protein
MPCGEIDQRLNHEEHEEHEERKTRVRWTEECLVVERCAKENFSLSGAFASLRVLRVLRGSSFS